MLSSITLVKGLVGITLATALVGGSPRTNTEPTAEPASAALASMTDTDLACGTGIGGIYFGFALDASPRYSIFAYRIDGGQWNYTHWYFMSRDGYWLYDAAGWSRLPADSSMTIRLIGGGHAVEAAEYRIDAATGSARWIGLGSCQTSDFTANVYSFPYSH